MESETKFLIKEGFLMTESKLISRINEMDNKKATDISLIGIEI